MQFKLIAIALFFVSFSAQAQTQIRRIEVEYAHASLTSGYSDWNDINVLNYFGTPENSFSIETDYKHHFDENAGVLGVNYTHVWSELWYQDFSVAFATNTAIVPGFLVFSEIHRKLLESQALVAGLGVGHNISRDPYSDTFGLAELVYYFETGFSVQAAIRVNQSSPGSVITNRYFGSVNYASDKWDAYVRFETGREGYTVVGDNQFKNEFTSKVETIQFHYWVTPVVGVGTTLEFYQSEFYNRSQAALNVSYRY